MRKRYGILLGAIAMAMLAIPSWAQNSKTTLQNLQAAVDGEASAHQKYLEFAKHADTEGYHGVASLFRAAAAAEQIHGACEAAVMKKMGASPTPKITPSAVKSTKENLEDSANKGEAYERDTMYPQYIAQARKDGKPGAARCFKWARDAEAEHFNLFTTAANNLNQMKERRDYFVCTEGGYTMEKLDAAKCPGGKYLTIK